MNKDGGPAFPHDFVQYVKGTSGMSLRDWFAMRYADAMIAERDK